MHTRIGTFNLNNLVRVGASFYDEGPHGEAEYEAKLAWIAGQLQRMNADVCGFQEVFHEEALLDAVRRSGRYDGGLVCAPGADGSGPHVGVATTLPVREAPQSIERFPAGVDLSVDDVPILLTRFRRPILRVGLELPNGHPLTVFVAHLKSKRPMVPRPLEHDPAQRALGKARALIVRAAEAAALRALVVEELRGTDRAVVVIGDLNDGVHAVTTEIITGTPPARQMSPEEKAPVWDTLLYSTYEIQARQSHRDVTYSHIHNGRYDTLDHILVSQELHRSNPDRIGEVEYLHMFNDHLVDTTLTEAPSPRVHSDHGQMVATIRLKRRRRARGSAQGHGEAGQAG